MSLYLVRHTTPAINSGICYGQTDLDLAASAEQDIQRVRDRLPDQISQVYSSPLRRCTKLALRLTDNTVEIRPALSELNFGAWEMQSWDTIPRADLDAWAKNIIDYAPANGESLNLMQQRVLSCWQQICTTRSKRDDTVVVTHAGVIRVIHAFEMGWPIHKMFDLTISYGGILRLSHGCAATKPVPQIL